MARRLRNVAPLLISVSSAYLFCGCPDVDTAETDNGGSDPSTTLTCGDLIGKVELDAIIGGISDFDESDTPFCEFDNGAGTGSIQAFSGASNYESMKNGAIDAYGEENVLITNNIGEQSFEWEAALITTIVTSQVGFLDSTSRYAVLITTDSNTGGMAAARAIALAVNANLRN